MLECLKKLFKIDEKDIDYCMEKQEKYEKEYKNSDKKNLIKSKCDYIETRFLNNGEYVFKINDKFKYKIRFSSYIYMSDRFSLSLYKNDELLEFFSTFSGVFLDIKDLEDSLFILIDSLSSKSI